MDLHGRHQVKQRMTNRMQFCELRRPWEKFGINWCHGEAFRSYGGIFNGNQGMNFCSAYEGCRNLLRSGNEFFLPKERVSTTFLQIASTKVSSSSKFSSCTRIPNWRWRLIDCPSTCRKEFVWRFPDRFFPKLQYYCVQMPGHLIELNQCHPRGSGVTLEALKSDSQARLRIQRTVPGFFIYFLDTLEHIQRN